MLFRRKTDGRLIDVSIDPAHLYQFSPQGGGFVSRVSLLALLNDYEPCGANRIERFGNLYLSAVQIDDGDAFECYLDNERWNGWRIPYFTRDQFLKAVPGSVSSHEGKIMVKDPEGGVATYEPSTYHVNPGGRQVELYKCDMGWIWDEAQPG